MANIHPERQNQPEGPFNPGSYRIYRFINKANLLNYGMNKIYSSLDLVKNMLVNTQKDKGNNFYGFNSEGSDSYQKMTQSLHELMLSLESGVATPAHIRKSFVNAYVAAKNYYSSHHGLTGYVYADSGKDRLKCSDFLVKNIPTMLNMYETFRLGVSTVADEFGEAYGNRTKDDIMSAAREYRRVNPEIAAIPMRPLPSYDEMVKLSVNQLKMKETIREFSKTFVVNYSYANDYDFYLNIKNNPSTKDKAKYYLSKKKLDSVYKLGVTSEQVIAINNSFNKDAFKAEYTALAENPVFKACVRSHPNDGLSQWNNIEVQTDAKLLEFQGRLNEINNNQFLDNAVRRLNGAEMNHNSIAELRQRQSGVLGDISEIIALKILQNPKVRPLVNQMVYTPNVNIKEELKNSIKTTLMNNNIVNPRGNESKRDAINRVINDDGFKAEALRNYQRTVARNRGRRRDNQVQNQAEHNANNIPHN